MVEQKRFGNHLREAYLDLKRAIAYRAKDIECEGGEGPVTCTSCRTRAAIEVAKMKAAIQGLHLIEEVMPWISLGDPLPRDENEKEHWSELCEDSYDRVMKGSIDFLPEPLYDDDPDAPPRP